MCIYINLYVLSVPYSPINIKEASTVKCCARKGTKLLDRHNYKLIQDTLHSFLFPLVLYYRRNCYCHHSCFVCLKLPEFHFQTGERIFF